MSCQAEKDESCQVETHLSRKSRVDMPFANRPTQGDRTRHHQEWETERYRSQETERWKPATPLSTDKSSASRQKEQRAQCLGIPAVCFQVLQENEKLRQR